MPHARAVLLGWADSTPSQLRVFERLYESLGIESLSEIAPIGAGLLHPKGYSQTAETMARVLTADLEPHPTLVHIFSDNGFVLWGALLARLSSTEKGLQFLRTVRGIVFDSAPGLWAAKGTIGLARYLATGTTSIITSRLGRNPIPPTRFLLTTALFGVFVGYRATFRRTVNALRTTVDQVRALQPHCPNLYLYGSADPIVLPRNVRAWVAGQRSRGIVCDMHEFEAARHVDLFSNDPERYRELLEAFASRTL